MGFRVVANVASFMGRPYEKLKFKMTQRFRHIRHTGSQAIRASSDNRAYPTTIVVFSPPSLGRFF